MQPTPSILTVAWSICAAACFMLALMHLLLWLRSYRKPEYLLSTLMAVAAGSNALLELALIFTTDIGSYLALLKFQVLCIFTVLMCLIWFVRLYLGTGPGWLLGTITALWSITIVSNFASPTGSVFSDISELARAETFWGESFTLARGTINPWKFLSDIASALILVYLLYATYGAWRNGRRQRAIVVGGGSVFFIILGGIHTPLVDAGIINTPYMVSFAFLAIVGALTWQIVRDSLDANLYAQQIERMSRALLLGEISSGLAHELNQPLTAILSNAQAARRILGSDEPNLDEIKGIVDDIIVDDKRAADIIRGLRAMLRGQDVEVTQVDLNREIRFIADTLAGELTAQDVDLQLELQPGLPPISADRVQFQQVVMNLLLNAIRATAKAARSRRIVAISSRAGDDSVLIAVTDTGPGISDAAMPHLFEPFFSVSSDGLGMGLAISRRIAERHGGKIWAENRNAGGAKFNYTLPMAAIESAR